MRFFGAQCAFLGALRNAMRHAVRRAVRHAVRPAVRRAVRPAMRPAVRPAMHLAVRLAVRPRTALPSKRTALASERTASGFARRAGRKCAPTTYALLPVLRRRQKVGPEQKVGRPFLPRKKRSRRYLYRTK